MLSNFEIFFWGYVLEIHLQVISNANSFLISVVHSIMKNKGAFLKRYLVVKLLLLWHYLTDQMK